MHSLSVTGTKDVLEQALADYSEVLSFSPDCAAIRARRGNLLHHLERYTEALQEFDRAIELESEVASHYYSRGMTYHALGQTEQALEDLNQALLRQRECTQILTLRGELYLGLGREDDALKDWSQVLLLEPLHVQALLHRGKLLTQRQQWREAIEDFSRLIDLHPSLLRPYFFRSECYEALGKIPQAISDALQALRCATEGMPEIPALVERLNKLGYEGPSSFPLPESPSRVELLAYMEQMPDSLFKQIQELHDKARSCMRTGEAEMAVTFYSAAIELDPSLFDSYIGRAQAYKRLCQYQHAMEDLAIALSLCPNSDHALYQRSLLHYDLGHMEQALADVKAALVLFPYSVDYHNQCGLLNMLWGRWKDAMASFEQVLGLDPVDSSAISQLGYLCLITGQAERAIHWYDLLLELDPEDSEAWMKRGEAHAASRQWSKALADWEQALNQSSTDPSLYFHQARAHFELQQPWMALEDIFAALHFSAEDTTLYRNAQSLHQEILGSLTKATMPGNGWRFPNIERLLQASEEEHALALIQSLLSLYPQHVLLLCLQGRAHHALYDYEKARLAFLNALSYDPNHPETLFFLGCFLADRGGWEEAVSYLNQAIRVHTESDILHEAHYQLGMCYKNLGRLQDSLAAFAQATSYRPDHAFTWMSRGLVESLLDRPGEAIASYNQTITLAPELSAPWFHRACEYARLGHKAPVLRDLAHAIERNPRYRRDAMTHEIFQFLWKDPELLRLVSE